MTQRGWWGPRPVTSALPRTGGVGAVTRDLGAWWALGTRGSTLLPSPVGTGSGSSSRSHFPSLEAFSLTKGAGGAGHLGGDTAYSPKPLNVIRISLYYGICKKQEKLSVHKFWIQILSKISSCRLNARMSRYFHLLCWKTIKTISTKLFFWLN